MREYDHGVEVARPFVNGSTARAAVKALFKAHSVDRSLEAFVAVARAQGFEVLEMWRRRRP